MTGAIKNREREGIWRRRNNGGFITWSYKGNILVLRKLSKLKQPYVLQKEKPNHKISIKIKIFVFQQRKCKKVKIISNCPILRFSIVPLIDAIVWKKFSEYGTKIVKSYFVWSTCVCLCRPCYSNHNVWFATSEESRSWIQIFNFISSHGFGLIL